MSLSTQFPHTREPRPAPPSNLAPTKASPPPALFWGDRFMLWCWVGCFFLMFLITVLDALAGLYRYLVSTE